MSLESSAEANRVSCFVFSDVVGAFRSLHTLRPVPSCQKAALEKLKFKKSSQQQTGSVAHSSASSTPPWHVQQQAVDAPPPQSRDATAASRYFPSTPLPAGRVLVPNSSPPAPDPLYRDNQRLFEQDTTDLIPGLNHAGSRKYPAPSAFVDSLSAPSGFTTSNRGTDASFSRPWTTSSRNTPLSSHEQGRTDGEPPRKRVNRGESPLDPIDFLQVPGSPEIQRPGQRRKLNAPIQISSDESFSEIDKDVAGPSRPRIVRGQRSEASLPPSTPETPANDADFIRFRIFNQSLHSDAKIRAAWKEAQEDDRKATALLSDPNFMAPKPLSIVKAKPRADDETGRVKEVEEATKAERARVKEIGKKSAIYAMSALPPITPPVSQANGDRAKVPLTPLTPASPDITAPRGKRLKRKIIDSETEEEPSVEKKRQQARQDVEDGGSSDSDSDVSDESEDTVNFKEALDYFNSASAEALQELTGMFSTTIWSTNLMSS